MANPEASKWSFGALFRSSSNESPSGHGSGNSTEIKCHASVGLISKQTIVNTECKHGPSAITNGAVVIGAAAAVTGAALLIKQEVSKAKTSKEEMKRSTGAEQKPFGSWEQN